MRTDGALSPGKVGPAVLSPGTRVCVRRDPEFGPWPAEPLGTVTPLSGQTFVEVATTRGSHRSYWITFDQPQFDTDGDGPYPTSQVLDIYLEVLSDD